MARLVFDPPLTRCCAHPDVVFVFDHIEGWGERRCPVHGAFRVNAEGFHDEAEALGRGSMGTPKENAEAYDRGFRQGARPSWSFPAQNQQPSGVTPLADVTAIRDALDRWVVDTSEREWLTDAREALRAIERALATMRR